MGGDLPVTPRKQRDAGIWPWRVGYTHEALEIPGVEDSAE